MGAIGLDWWGQGGKGGRGGGVRDRVGHNPLGSWLGAGGSGLEMMP